MAIKALGHNYIYRSSS